MIRRPPRSTRTDTLFPYTTLFRSKAMVDSPAWRLVQALQTLVTPDGNKPAIEGWYENVRSEEHTSELQSLMRISYAVFCLKKKKKNPHCNIIKRNSYTTYTIHTTHSYSLFTSTHQYHTHFTS